MRYLITMLILVGLYAPNSLAVNATIELLCTDNARMTLVTNDNPKLSTLSYEGTPPLPFSHYTGVENAAIAVFSDGRHYLKLLIKNYMQEGRSEFMLASDGRWIPCVSTKATKQ
ncbi:MULTISPECIES: hypothetical protein [unclassified Providencia]|uniref:hypothetical protein n=1 Tax=unclassified Providencia TaxID=2633465 RepID=UPI00234BFE0F|nr:MULTISPECIES: hypothetical protein [unclassified Providencia]WOB99066.1 hypothetical protein P3L55_17645 [Providencia sp. PROV046]WOC00518.1 hypothetical protein P3L55_04125 [Providencia sp. PROV046]HEM7130795.1 hypothetical protein [Providencia rettgeri]